MAQHIYPRGMTMTEKNSPLSTIADWKAIGDRLGTALVLDILDARGLKHQALKSGVVPRTVNKIVVGSAKTLLWMDFAHDDPATYELELKAIDSLQTDELVVCATGNSERSGIWGELLTTAALRNGAVGIVTDGAVRDIAQVEALNFPVFSRSVCPYDSFNRQKVVAYDVRVEIDGVAVEPGDIIVADRDGVAVVPKALEGDVLKAVLDKANREDQFRDAVKSGTSLFAAYQQYQVL
jgi:4-hydroxy-4-methyl-2-oxoglutarate aldolase